MPCQYNHEGEHPTHMGHTFAPGFFMQDRPEEGVRVVCAHADPEGLTTAKVEVALRLEDVGAHGVATTEAEPPARRRKDR